MPRYFHVSSSLNRESIREHGLDWVWMGAAWGIAGSRLPEVKGIFLCREYEVDWFTSMNTTGGDVDVWAVDGVDAESFLESPNGYFYVPEAIPSDRLTLVKTDIPAADR